MINSSDHKPLGDILSNSDTLNHTLQINQSNDQMYAYKNGIILHILPMYHFKLTKAMTRCMRTRTVSFFIYYRCITFWIRHNFHLKGQKMSEIKGKFKEFVFRLYHEAVNELALIEKLSISCESRRKKYWFRVDVWFKHRLHIYRWFKLSLSKIFDPNYWICVIKICKSMIPTVDCIWFKI